MHKASRLQEQDIYKANMEKMKIEHAKVKRIKRMDIEMEMIKVVQARKITRHPSLESVSGTKSASMCQLIKPLKSFHQSPKIVIFVWR
eukprot:1336775-Ditylum_brightwellii.AAC.1